MEIGESHRRAQRRMTPSPARPSRGVARLRHLTRLLVAHHTLDDLDAWRTEVQREAERLIPLLEHDSAAAVRAKAWRMVAFVHGVVCHWQETADALERAISAARLAEDARQVARLSSSYVMALSEGPTPIPVAIERAEEVLAYGLVDRQAEAVALLTVAPLHAMSGDFERAREIATQGGGPAAVGRGGRDRRADVGRPVPNRADGR
jgi:hypothetical protein